MERGASVLTTALSLLVAAQVAFGAEFSVGDRRGWTFQVNYTNWAAPRTFRIGDTLSFQYTGVHNVLEVSKADYDSCDASKALQTHSTASPIKVALSRSGEHWFICGIAGHCDAGMKLQINVLADAPAPRAVAPAPRRARDAPPPSSLAVSPSPVATPFQAPSPSQLQAPSPSPSQFQAPSPSPLLSPPSASTPTPSPSTLPSPTQSPNQAPDFQSFPPASSSLPPASSPDNSAAFSKAAFGWLAAAASGLILVLM